MKKENDLRNWKVKSSSGETLEIAADDVVVERDLVTFMSSGKIIACFWDAEYFMSNEHIIITPHQRRSLHDARSVK